ncbi:MAG: hypothetical protein RQ754_01860 [Desulfuromonadales bacterium]|nr:hypothetical protein [Desulfuromonadales bacterium]
MRVTAAGKNEARESSKTAIGTTLLVITFRVAIILTLIVLVSISVWVVLLLFGGLVSAGDPLTMIRGWFEAVSGH